MASKLLKLSQAELQAKGLSAKKVFATMGPIGGTPVLGSSRAINIVCASAKTSPTNINRNLAQLGVNGIAFQKNVFAGVKYFGYFIPISMIPAARSTTLLQVATVIQNAPLA